MLRDLIDRIFGRWGGVANRRPDAPVEWRRMLRRNPTLALLLDNPAVAHLLFPTAGVQRKAQSPRSAGRGNPGDHDSIPDSPRPRGAEPRLDDEEQPSASEAALPR